ncbi:hypothetical protein HYU12_02675 [Candidatus Woesearchaeota archaeon]|nr:hypothetical protein [Candidatus Woesearchaeota archaeon]
MAANPSPAVVAAAKARLKSIAYIVGGAAVVGALGIASYAAVNSNTAREETSQAKKEAAEANNALRDDLTDRIDTGVASAQQQVTDSNNALQSDLTNRINKADTSANNRITQVDDNLRSLSSTVTYLSNSFNSLLTPTSTPKPAPVPYNVLIDCNNPPLSITDTANFISHSNVNFVCLPAGISTPATPTPTITVSPTATKTPTPTATATASVSPTVTATYTPTPTPVKVVTPADSVTAQAAKQYLDSFNSLPDNVVRRVLFYSVNDCNKVTFAVGTVGADRKITYTAAQHFQVASRSQLEEIANAVGAKIPSGESKRDATYSCIDSRGVTDYLVGLTAHKPSNVDQLRSLADAVKREAVANLLGRSSVKVNPPLNYH